MEVDLFGNEIVKDVLLRDKFIVNPFSVFETYTGEWQKRKNKWKNIGMKSEIGRDVKANANVHTFKNSRQTKSGFEVIEEQTSIFDPVLCEVLYSWFCPDGGAILDPFAGGSVRGIVANYLSYKYTGLELRQEQVDSNREQSLNILPIENQPQWYCGDSDKLLDDNWQHKFDFIFSCPPYADLEVYSDLPDDLSNMDYKDFLTKYCSIIKKSLELLKPNSYACFVVGDVRDKQGYYLDFISDTKKAFINSGAKLYNEIILVAPIGTGAMQAGRNFPIGLKVHKRHQNVLIFKKP
jgi:DNA modification methylase